VFPLETLRTVRWASRAITVPERPLGDLLHDPTLPGLHIQGTGFLIQFHARTPVVNTKPPPRFATPGGGLVFGQQPNRPICQAAGFTAPSDGGGRTAFLSARSPARLSARALPT